ncbi:hypothetical protein Dimus_020626 [Dionaea muscipula]
MMVTKQHQLLLPFQANQLSSSKQGSCYNSLHRTYLFHLHKRKKRALALFFLLHSYKRPCAAAEEHGDPAKRALSILNEKSIFHENQQSTSQPFLNENQKNLEIQQ